MWWCGIKGLLCLVHDATHALTPAKFLNSLMGSLLQGFLSSRSSAATDRQGPSIHTTTTT